MLNVSTRPASFARSDRGGTARSPRRPPGAPGPSILTVSVTVYASRHLGEGETAYLSFLGRDAFGEPSPPATGVEFHFTIGTYKCHSPTLLCEIMAELVSIDSAGRLVIPKAIREAAGIDQRAKLVIAVAHHGQLILQKLYVETVAARLNKEMAGKDVDAIFRKGRKELKVLVRQKYPDLLS